MKSCTPTMAAAAALSLHPTAAFSFHRPNSSIRPPPSLLRAVLSDKTETNSDPFFLDDNNEKQWPVKQQPASADSFQRSRLAEQLRLSSSRSTTGFGSSSDDSDNNNSALMLSTLTSGLSTALRPLIDPEIEKDVPPSTILGAAANGSFVTLFAFLILGLPIVAAFVASLNAAVVAAYLSITRGSVGNIIREVGRYTATVTESVAGMMEEYDAGRKVEKASRAMETLNRVGAAESEEAVVLDRAVREVQRAESELEAKQRELEAAALRRKQALVDAAAKLEEVARAKAGAAGREVLEASMEGIGQVADTAIMDGGSPLEVSVFLILFDTLSSIYRTHPTLTLFIPGGKELVGGAKSSCERTPYGPCPRRKRV
jgi:hypothetical protein